MDRSRRLRALVLFPSFQSVSDNHPCHLIFIAVQNLAHFPQNLCRSIASRHVEVSNPGICWFLVVLPSLPDNKGPKEGTLFVECLQHTP